jgi:hypothetical protein
MVPFGLSLSRGSAASVSSAGISSAGISPGGIAPAAPSRTCPQALGAAAKAVPSVSTGIKILCVRMCCLLDVDRLRAN